MTITPTTVEELLDYWPGNVPFKGSLVSEDGTCMCAQGQALHYLGGLTVEDLRRIDQRVADRKTAELFGISRAHAVLLRIVNDNANGAPACVIRNPEQILGDQAETVLAFWRCLDHTSPATWAAARAAARAAAGEAARAADWAAARAADWGAVGEADWAAVGEANWGAGWAAAREAARGAAWAAAWGAVGEAARAADWAAARAAAGGAVGAAAGEAAWAADWSAAGEADWAAVGEANWGAGWAAARATHEIQGAAVMRAKNQQFFFLPLFGFANPAAVVAADRAERGDA
jgi:hypothetical protein